jgi:hypothetical protein
MADSRQAQGRSTVQGDKQTGSPGGSAPHVEAQHDNHGQSTAAWTAVGICMIGALIMSIAVVIASVWLFVVGAVVAVLGAVSGKVLSAMGFGVSGRPGH